MRILYLSQYFPPEIGATQNRAYEMASNLIDLGHSVTMLTEIPNHPSGIIPPQYRHKIFERSTLSGIEVIRTWVYATPNKTFRRRMLFYISFMVNATFAGALLVKGQYDIIYATSPPLFVGAAAIALSKIKGIPLVFEVRDLWPGSAIELGELKNHLAIKWATRLEHACYNKATKIIVVTNGTKDHLVARGIPENKLDVIPNGANTELFKYNPIARELIRHRLGLADKFVVIYAGIHGIAQGLDTVIEAAGELRDHDDIFFLFVGEGPKKSHLQLTAVEQNLSNVLFIDEQPRETIPDYLSASDVALVPLRRAELFKIVLPSKLFDAWACERPVLLSVEGEAKHILETAQGGLVITPEDPEELISALKVLKSSVEYRQNLGQNGRLFTHKYYSRRSQAEKLSIILEGLSR
ncbi:MAG TPA: glycosyltransferase family 4 protein [Anaerolineales bacterium]|nr:glycosyltransferase family 4 protein [Anaerolineales bacterium]